MRPVALVTGGADRIGAAFVRALAQDGYDVALHFHSRAQAAQETAADARAFGGAVETIQADLSIAQERESLISSARNALGRAPSVLVNCASLFRFDALAELEAPLWSAHLEVNLTAPVFLIRDFARAVGEGVVINILDQKLNRPNPDFFSYTASRMGLAGHDRAAGAGPGPAHTGGGDRTGPDPAQRGASGGGLRQGPGELAPASRPDA